MSLADFYDNLNKMISNLPDLALKPKANRCIYEIKNAIGIPTYKYLNKANSKYFEYQKEVIIFGKFKITNIEHNTRFTLITLEYESNGINNMRTVAKQIIENVISYDKYFQKYKEEIREIRSNPELSTDEENELVDKLKKKFKKKESKLYEKTLSY